MRFFHRSAPQHLYTTPRTPGAHLVAQFSPGQLVHHTLFDYRGVIVDVDPTFQRSSEWYKRVALTRPPKDLPWYRVLVHDSNGETYVAERNLELDLMEDPIEHPRIDQFFSTFNEGIYHKKGLLN
ncbi:MAG: heat shock protein HspQ [Magnetococcales bacterium]|nr:heat shock protein HspQ [Magnetococcales bacterium]